ncbi:hypothetical protein DPMN_042971 [Dreissena polymorpha]|uniref:Uncharacterized protein n=1 Tax=Dreissena polymorpha TaxID=45954 RepID=A0A9D4CZL5_DREPO|nr:hypothetical protein DPMN_042971 [Dreissena polymorpha]
MFGVYDGGMCLTTPYSPGAVYGLHGLLGVSSRCGYSRVGSSNSASVHTFENKVYNLTRFMYAHRFELRAVAAVLA